MSLRTVGLWSAACLLMFASYGPSEASAAKRPNVLWISCEDIGPRFGCYGDRLVVTPNVDRLAAEGVRYTRTFTVAGVCAPNRTGIITGMYPTSIGGHHMRCKATLPKHIKCFPEYLRKAGYYCTNNSKTDYNFGWSKSDVWDESSRRAHWRGRPRGKPFFAVFNFTTCHEGQIRLSEQSYAKRTARLTPDERQDPERIVVPPYHPDTPVAHRDRARLYELITAMDYQAGDVLRQLEEDGLADETIVFFWSDHGDGLPRQKRSIYDSGTHVPLIARIPEKLRAGGQGEPGTVDDRLINSIDFGPTVLNLVGAPIPEDVQGQPFLGPNLPPPRPFVVSVRDRMDERYDMIRTVRDKRYRYIRNFHPWKTYYQYMNTPEGGPTMRELRRLYAEGKLRPEAAQFMAERKPPEELYDLEIDPHEVRNLAGLPEHRERLGRMRRIIRDWAVETKDLGLMPEPEINARTDKLGSAHAILRQSGADELLAELSTMASLAAGAGVDKKGLATLGAGLKHPDAGVRWWAATGLGNFAQDAHDAEVQLTDRLEDPAPVVRVAAARALCLMGKPGKALPVLTAELASDKQWVRLHAALALDEIGPQARPAVDALKQALKDKRNKYVVRVSNHALNELLGTDNKVR